jgi:pimeloyl-ACP methyl ester carboxylesterase
MKDILHFSHANGFPAGSYQTLFSYLSADFDISFIERLGHKCDYPVANNWQFLAQELIDDLLARYKKPVYLVGHSLGGVLSMMVSAQRPDLVKGLIMLDSPVLTSFEARGLTLVKYLGLIDRVTPAGRTLGRQEEWDSLEATAQYFQGKKLFRAFDARCLKDYVEQGTREAEGGKRILHFDPQTEIKIYRTIPDNLHKIKRLKMPSVVIAGKYSDVFKKHHGFKAKRQLGMEVEWVEGGHMFPLENPQLTTTLIKRYVKQWEGK